VELHIEVGCKEKIETWKLVGLAKVVGFNLRLVPGSRL